MRERAKRDEQAMYDVIVVGAGMAGLSAAWALRDRRLLLLDGADRVGGRLHGTLSNTAPLSLGAHMVPGAGTRIGSLVEAMGLAAPPLPSRLFALAEGGRHYERTPQVLLPLAMRLSPRERLGFMRLGLALRRGARRSVMVARGRPGEPPDRAQRRALAFEDTRTLADYVGPLPPRIEALLATLTERTGADPAEMSAGHGLRSFANVWARGAPGTNLRGGAVRLPAALAAALGTRLRLGHRVLHVAPATDGVQVTAATPEGEVVLSARAAILATPAPVTSAIAPGLPATVDSALSGIRYGPFLSLSLLAETGGTNPLAGTYATLTPDMPFSVVFNHDAMLEPADIEQGVSLFMLFRGARGAAREMEQDDAALTARWLAGFEALLPGLRGRIRATAIGRWPLGAPFTVPGGGASRLALAETPPPVALAGDYLDAPNMEAAAQSGLRAAERVGGWLGEGVQPS